jgi:nicotinamide mononucleotide adenylyltransferase
LTIAIYLAHLNPVTNAHVEIIEELKKENKVVVMPVRFLNEEKEVNSKSFPFDFEIRKKMIESVFGDSVLISPNYTFYAPFKKYLPPLISPKSWSLRKQILQGIENGYFTYTGDKAEGLMLKLYRLNPKVGTRKLVSATNVKNEMYANSEGKNSEWKKFVPVNVAKIIIENWQIIEKFASAEDMTKRIAGMKFPKEGYDSK